MSRFIVELGSVLDILQRARCALWGQNCYLAIDSVERLPSWQNESRYMTEYIRDIRNDLASQQRHNLHRRGSS